MATLQAIVDNKKIKELGLQGLLTDDKLIETIDSENKDDLRDLLISVIHSLLDNSIKLEDLYYAEYIVISDELFDMFSRACLEEIFNLFGYKTELIKNNTLDSELWIGEMKVYNENLEVYLFAEESMHDSFISIFVNTKIARYTKKNN